MICKRLSSISSSENEFNKSKAEYEKALSNSNFKAEMKYEKTESKKKINRSRNITWFNPPFSENVDTNIGQKFLNFIKKHFTGNKLSKIFNNNTLKLSYSCMPNMKSIISKHNKSILSPKTSEVKLCNCRNRDKCPLDGQCLQKAIIYKATVLDTTDNTSKSYIGLTEGPFKERFSNHKQSLTKPEKANSTRLSQHFWKLKQTNSNTSLNSIQWEIIRKSAPYMCGSRKCDLCTSEKLEIITNSSNDILNKRNELANKCRHNVKFKLSSVT